MNQRLPRALAAVALAAALAACGGLDDDETTPAATAEVPASASQSTDGWIAYLQRLVASAADTLEPVDTAAVTPPTTETAEPTVVD
jgi:ABC-type glycerol-3-phosphate transport system substrate-binding protein